MNAKPKSLLTLCLLGLWLTTSCIVIDGYHSDYKRLTEAQKARVIRTSLPIDSLRYDSCVYVVRIEQLKDFLAAHDSTMVYDWIPRCPSTACKPPWIVERYCKRQGLACCILLSSYYWPAMPPQGSISTPILFVDTKPYGTDVVWKYSRCTTSNLLGIPWEEIEQREDLDYCNDMIFHRDKFVGFRH